MLTLEELQKILNGITFNPSCVDMGWRWRIEESYKMAPTGHFYTAGFTVYPSFQRPDTTTGVVGTGYGGGVFIPVDADETRIVMKAWNAIELTVRHELMEAFCYMGERVLNPHKSIDELVYPAVLNRSTDERETADAINPQRITSLG